MPIMPSNGTLDLFPDFSALCTNVQRPLKWWIDGSSRKQRDSNEKAWLTRLIQNLVIFLKKMLFENQVPVMQI